MLKITGWHMPFEQLKEIQKTYFRWLNEAKTSCFTCTHIFFNNLSEGIISSRQMFSTLNQFKGNYSKKLLKKNLNISIFEIKVLE